MGKLKDCDILSGPLQVAFDITNKCNFRCLHCYNDSGENLIIEEELSDQEVIDFMHELGKLNISNLCFCGGEPLLRKDLICKCAKILSSYGLKSMCIVTNGFLITKEIVKDLMESGVVNFQVSLDGKSSDSHDLLRNKKGAFDKVISAIEIIKDCGVQSLDVAFSCTNFNIDEMKEVYYMCNDLGISSFRLQPLMIIGRATKNEEKIALNHIEYRKYIKYVYELINEYKSNTKLRTEVDFGDPIDHILRGKNFDAPNYAITVRANGDLTPSPYLPITVGNIRKHTLKEYWDNGLGKVWELELIKNIANEVISSTNFGNRSGEIPKVWIEEDIKIDLIELSKKTVPQGS